MNSALPGCSTKMGEVQARGSAWARQLLSLVALLPMQ